MKNLPKAISRFLRLFDWKARTRAQSAIFEVVLGQLAIDSYKNLVLNENSEYNTLPFNENSEDLDFIYSQCLSLTKEQLISILSDQHSLLRIAKRKYGSSFRATSFENCSRQFIHMIDVSEGLARGDLGERFTVCTPDMGSLEYVFEKIHEVLGDFDKAIDYLPHDHDLYRKYRRKKY